MNLWNVGNGMPDKANDRRQGADPPKNVAGSTGTHASDECLSKADAARSLERPVFATQSHLCW